MAYQLQPHADISRIIYLDSRDADYYLATDSNGYDMKSYFSYTLKEGIVIPDNQGCLLSLNSASIPYSFYNIRSGVNDKLEIRVGASDGAGGFTGTEYDIDITITQGNYNAITLATEVESKIESGITSGTPLTIDITITYNKDIMKFLYEMETDGYMIQFRMGTGVDITLSEETLRIELGLQANNTQQFYQESSTKSNLTSPNVIDINGSIHGLYIRTNLTSISCLDSLDKTFSNIIARVPLNVPSGGIIFHNPRDATHKTLINTHLIKTLTIRLTDERNRLINLNGLDFQIAIACDFIYLQNRINPPNSFQRRIVENYRADRIKELKENVHARSALRTSDKSKTKSRKTGKAKK